MGLLLLVILEIILIYIVLLFREYNYKDMESPDRGNLENV